jgi:hypothetical protein
MVCCITIPDGNWLITSACKGTEIMYYVHTTYISPPPPPPTNAVCSVIITLQNMEM